MGWNFGAADWSVVEGASFPGAGGAAPGIWTLIAVIACVVVLVMGNSSEKKHLNAVKKK